jgi:2-hydroxychromene-2-carboxylate isomerase
VSGSASSPVLPRADWYFDFISPFAYLQFKAMAKIRARLDVTPRPILFAAVLDHHGQKGPAEIPLKRRFSYRFVQWQADRLGVPLRFPPAHPFNPLAALRLAVAGGADWALIDAIFDHVWGQGLAGDSAEALSAIAARFDLDAATAIADTTAKERLRDHTAQAIAAGVFGVPTVAVGGELFWGQDATPMLMAYLDAPDLFQSEAMRRLDTLPVAVERRAARG